MAYFAKVEDGKVENVIKAVNAPDDTYIETFRDRSQRKNYAGVGMDYNSELDMFIEKSPYPSWLLNQAGDWVAPVNQPEGDYYWDEEEGNWVANA